MTISDTAKAHHDQLFGDRVPALARTNPKFIAYVDNVAVEEILGDAADLDDSIGVQPTPRSAGTLPGTSTSATAARGCWPSWRGSCRSPAVPAH